MLESSPGREEYSDTFILFFQSLPIHRPLYYFVELRWDHLVVQNSLQDLPQLSSTFRFTRSHRASPELSSCLYSQ